MANKDSGDFRLKIGDQVYRLVFDLEAMDAMEQYYSTPDKEVHWPEVQQKLQKQSVRAMRVMLWAMFQEHHPDVTYEDAKQLVKHAGGIAALGEIIAGALRSATPDPADAKELAAAGVAKSGPPTKAQAGTGETSNLTPAASA